MLLGGPGEQGLWHQGLGGLLLAPPVPSVLRGVGSAGAGCCRSPCWGGLCGGMGPSPTHAGVALILSCGRCEDDGGAAGVGCGAVVPRSRGCRWDGGEEMLSSPYHTDLSPACWRCPRAPNQHQRSAAAPSIALEWEMKVAQSKAKQSKTFLCITRMVLGQTWPQGMCARSAPKLPAAGPWGCLQTQPCPLLTGEEHLPALL